MVNHEVEDAGQVLSAFVYRCCRCWRCPRCGWTERISEKRRHIQTNQPLGRAEILATLTLAANKHFREHHLDDFMKPGVRQ